MNRQSLNRRVQRAETQLGSRKPNKYGAKKVELDGRVFDSKAEARYYERLKLLQMSGVVKSFRTQPEYILQEKYRNAEGKARAAIKYTADFEVTYSDGHVEVVDVKGMASRDFSLRLRLFEKRYEMALKVVKPEDIKKMG